MGWNDFKYNPYGGLEKYLGTDSDVTISRSGPFPICKGAFQGCRTLETIVIPEGCYEIEKNAFADCINLREATLPSTLHLINEYAFANCTSLRILHFPQGIYRWQGWPIPGPMTVYSSAFNNCISLADANGLIAIGGVAWHCLNKSGVITVSEGITELSKGLFRGSREITEVRLPEGLTTLGQDVFSGCESLRKINIPSSVHTIQKEAFQDCTGLYPAGSDFLILDGWLCGYRGNCAEVVIPEGITAIADSVFACHGEIHHISIPQSVGHIGKRAFEDCTNLQGIKLPDQLETLSDAVFCNCAGLQSVQLPGSLKKIGVAAFRGCSSLTSLQLPEGLREIYGQAFSQCSQLAQMNLPDSLKMIAGNPFDGCPFLPREDGLIIADGKLSGYQGSGGDVVIPEGVTVICAHTFQSTNITGVVFPKSLRCIETQAFSMCKQLRRVDFAEGLVSIGWSAFYLCAIEKLILPKTLRVIEKEAFASNRIREVILPVGLEEIGDRVFVDCPIRSVSLTEKQFYDHGLLPGENHRWVDNFIDANPFPYKDGEIIRTRIICRDFHLTAQKMAEWAEFLSLESPIIQVWIRDWYDCEAVIPAAFFFDDGADYRCPWLAPLTLDELPRGHEDYVVVILNRNAITELIRSDDESVMAYLENIGPDILRDLIVIAEEAGAKTVLTRLNRLHEEISALTPDDLL